MAGNKKDAKFLTHVIEEADGKASKLSITILSADTGPARSSCLRL